MLDLQKTETRLEQRKKRLKSDLQSARDMIKSLDSKIVKKNE